MEQIITDTPLESSRIKKVDRSAAYPSISIEDSEKFVSEINKHFRKDFAKRDDILALVEGSHPRHIAASCYYQFLNREKDTYQVSDLYRSISNFILISERSLGLLKAFESPKLNKELIAKFDGGELPKERELKAHLFRFHKITEDAAPLAAEVFIKNAKFCSVLDDKNVLNFQKTKLAIENQSVNGEEIKFEEIIEAEPAVITNTKPESQTSKESVVSIGSDYKQPLLLEEMNNKEEIKIRLTGRRFAYLIYPDNLNKTDIEILNKQIEQLALIIE